MRWVLNFTIVLEIYLFFFQIVSQNGALQLCFRTTPYPMFIMTPPICAEGGLPDGADGEVSHGGVGEALGELQGGPVEGGYLHQKRE
jgi:hypothetical protein